MQIVVVTALILSILLQAAVAVDDADLFFPRKNIDNYATAAAMSAADLGEVSVCFWVRTRDTTTDLTVLSYGVEGQDNELVIYMPVGSIRFYVGGPKKEVSVELRDGQWHHACVLWRRVAGRWAIYIDGSLVKQGIALHPNGRLRSGGTLVLGQEQDVVGGGLDPTQSFVGSISDLNIFGRSLTAHDVATVRAACTNRGDVLAWSDILADVHGSVAVIRPSSHPCTNGATKTDPPTLPQATTAKASPEPYRTPPPPATVKLSRRGGPSVLPANTVKISRAYQPIQPSRSAARASASPHPRYRAATTGNVEHDYTPAVHVTLPERYHYYSHAGTTTTTEEPEHY
ncbi:PREDICTED: neuronal pentraxin-1-like isoform X2 [Priapulus caudatus]|nr:PREDICTED: neuronal pentraxin-1-like isoform X2 [Priapulus caudatus]